jgi:hypothetical protein
LTRRNRKIKTAFLQPASVTYFKILLGNLFIFIVMLFLPLGNRSISQTSTPYVIINGFIFIDQITTCHLSADKTIASV